MTHLYVPQTLSLEFWYFHHIRSRCRDHTEMCKHILLKKTYQHSKKKCLLLVFPYLEIISLQTRTKLQEALRSIFSYCKLDIVFKCQTTLCNSFPYKDPIPKELISDNGYTFSVWSLQWVLVWWKEVCTFVPIW